MDNLDIYPCNVSREDCKISQYSLIIKIFIHNLLALWCGPRIASLPLPRHVVRGD